MVRSIASLLLVGLVATTGCNKETPKASPAPSNTEPISVTSVAVKTTSEPPPQCQKLCRIVGKCAFKDGKCYAAFSQDCHRSFGCKTGGLCEVKDGLCQATKDAHCKKSELCQSQGRCIAVNGRCEHSSTQEPDNK